jgi:DNA-binding GntR family transcriptional regulator
VTGTSDLRLPRVPTRPKLAEEVVEALRQSLLTGSYKRGDHLVLEAIAAQLGISVMPVREALISLSHEGLVISLPRRGFRANPPDATDLRDLFDLHAYLAGTLTGRAAVSASVHDIAALEEIHSSFVKLARKPMNTSAARELYELNYQFHRRIHLLADGERLRWFLRLTTRFVRRDQYTTSPIWVETTLRDHPKIIDAIRAGDAERARAITEEHFRIDSELPTPSDAAVS